MPKRERKIDRWLERQSELDPLREQMAGWETRLAPWGFDGLRGFETYHLRELQTIYNRYPNNLKLLRLLEATAAAHVRFYLANACVDFPRMKIRTLIEYIAKVPGTQSEDMQRLQRIVNWIQSQLGKEAY